MTPRQPDLPPDPITAQPVVTPTTVVDALPSPTLQPTADPDPGGDSAPEESIQSPDPEWVQETFGDAWSIGYPAGWTVNAAGAHEGTLQLQGDYAGHSYAVTFSYPIGILASSLDAWLDEYLAPLTPEQQQAVVVSDLIVANTPAKKVLNFPTADGTSTAHHVYLWRSEAKNPRLVTISQIDGQPLDVGAMEQLLDRLLALVQE